MSSALLRSVLVIFGIFVLEGCFSVRSSNRMSYQKLEPAAYAIKLSESSGYYLIDVRTPSEFQKSHIKGAENKNFLKLNFGRQVNALDHSRTVFIYCHTCHRSPFCARVLRRKGFRNVYDLNKGFSEWLKTGLPVDSTVEKKGQ